MKLIVGLGNPGAQYARTRHNAGFLALERLAKRCGLEGVAPRGRFHSAVLDGIVAGEKCVLMQPQTFMNRSGLAVGEAVTFYKVDPETELMIVVDEVALPVGTIRLRSEGSAGGHNGLKDIQRALGGSNVYPRLRIGIDPPGRVPRVDYVLQRFSEDQMKQLDPALDKACDAIECWIDKSIDHAMSLYNA